MTASVRPCLPAARASPRRRAVTALVGTLAFVALTNTVLKALRLLAGQPSHGSVLPLPASGALALVLGLWWAVRVKRSWAQRTVPDARADAGAGAGADVGSGTGAGEPGPSCGRPAGAPILRGRTRRLPSWVVRSLVVGRWLAAAGLAVGAGLTVSGQWSTVTAALGHLHRIDWRWLRLAVYAEGLSVVAFGSVCVLLLRAGGARIGLGAMMGLVVAGNAMALSLPGGAAWAATFSFAQLRRRGVRRALALRVLVSASVLSAAGLVTLLAVGVDVAGDAGPAAGFQPVTEGAAAAVALAGVAMAVARRRRGRGTTGDGPDRRVGRSSGRVGTRSESVGGWGGRGESVGALEGRRAWIAGLHRRIEAWGGRIGEMAPLGGPQATGAPTRRTRRRLAAGFVAALLNWVFDCGCLVAAILAVGGHVPWQGLLVAYGVGQVAQNLPVTPGGVGVVEGVLSVMLAAYGMPSAIALAAVLVYRIISFWLLVPLGWVTAGVVVWSQRRARTHLAAAPLGRARPGAQMA